MRQLSARPGLSFIVMLTLALGIGATTAIYSLFHTLLLRPMPVPEPDALVNLRAPGPLRGMVTCSDAGDCSYVFSYPMFRDLEREQAVFTGVAAHRTFSANLANEGQTLAGTGMLVSGQYFSVLGIEPALGRLLTPADEPRIDESAVVVLSHAYWESRFGRDPGVLGRMLVINGIAMEIVGVAPRGFDGTTLGTRAHVFVPLTMAWAVQPTFERSDERRDAYWLYLFARLRTGVTNEQATAGINAVYQPIIQEVEVPLNAAMSASALEQFAQRAIELEPGARGQSTVPDQARVPLTLLLGVTALVLLIACVNIANLLLARGAARSGEMAVRASLGARQRDLIGQLFTESALLAAAGFVASLPVAMFTLRAIETMLPQQAASNIAIELSVPAIVFAAALSGATLLVFALVPALQASRTDANTVLKGHAGQSGGSRAMARFRHSLATSQIAFSMMLLVLAGLFTYSLANVSRVDLGLRTDSIVTFSVAPRLNGYTADSALRVFERIEAELTAHPGTTHASGSVVSLLSNDSWQTGVGIEGRELEPGAASQSVYNEVSPGFIDTLGIGLLRGRDFTLADRDGAPRVALVNQAFVRQFELGDDVVGRRIGITAAGERDIEIVGVIADAKYSTVKGEIPAQYLIPWRQNGNIGALNYYVRTELDPNELLSAIPRLVARIDPHLPVSNLSTFALRVQENVFLDRLVTVLSAAFATLATVLAAIGLYGVLAYNVAQRTREIGLRLALGAKPQRLRAMVLSQVARMAVVGGVIGLLGAVVIGRYAESLLFGLTGYDPRVLLSAVAVLAGVVFLAAYVPAVKASRLAPMEALRHE